MLYLKHSYNLTHIITKNGLQKALKPSLTIVKLLCEKELFSYESRIRLIKKHINIKTKIPVYINDNLLLMPTKSPKNYNNIWLNYFEIFDYKSFNNKVIVLFKNLEELIIEITLNSFKNMLRKAEQILNYFNNKNNK